MKITSYSLLRKAIFLSAIFFLTFLFSCKKDGKLAPDFDNGNLSVSFVDTFSILTSIVQEDSLRTDLSTSNLLGIYNDPIFGPVSSSIYTQVLLTGVNVNFETTTTNVDSVVLTLDYNGLYGNPYFQASVNVYELDSKMDKDVDYYSNTIIPHKMNILGSSTFTPNLTDSVNLNFNSTTLKPHLRIRLNDSFGDSLLAADDNGSKQLADNATFTSFMKGLLITRPILSKQEFQNPPPPGTGSILSFDMNSSMSTLTIYYDDTSSYNFTINTSETGFG